MTLEENSYQRLTRLDYDLLAMTNRKLVELKDENARRHLGEGFNRRLLMMQSSRFALYEGLEHHPGGPLEPEKTQNLSVHLNAYYFNLSGAFDNLAWCVTHEHRLTDPVVEEGGRGSSRRFCFLFGEKFQAALSGISDEAAQVIAAEDEWYQDLKHLRDPSAHRIPPYLVGSVLDETGLAEYQRLYRESNERFSEAEKVQDLVERMDVYESAFDLRREAEALGEYRPLVVTSEASGKQVKWLPSLIEDDHDTFLRISSSMVMHAL